MVGYFAKILLFAILSAVTGLGRGTVLLQSRRFARTEIEVSKITSENLQSETVSILSHVVTRDQYAAYFCNTVQWCSVFCRMTEDSYLLTNAVASPFRTVTDGSASVPCFTSRPEGEMIGELGSLVSVASSTRNNDPKKGPENLLDSFYDGDEFSCFFPKNSPNPTPYIVFDLGARRTVTEIRMIAQPDSQASTLFQKLDMRLGDDLQEGDFTSYRRFHYFDGAATGPGYEYQSPATVPPVEGRFLSIQSDEKKVQICHVEIFGY